MQFCTKLMLKELNNGKRLTTLGSFCLKRRDIDKGSPFYEELKGRSKVIEIYSIICRNIQ